VTAAEFVLAHTSVNSLAPSTDNVSPHVTCRALMHRMSSLAKRAGLGVSAPQIPGDRMRVPCEPRLGPVSDGHPMRRRAMTKILPAKITSADPWRLAPVLACS
jgi:hypothetical protein